MRSLAVTSPPSMVSPPLLLLFLLLSFLPGGAPDLTGDAAALLAFRTAVGRSVIQWNATASPCSWRGIHCSGVRVTALRLPGAGLLGAIPVGTIANLTALRVISLRLNALSGSLPPDISNLHNLRSLFLRGNRFSGELPSELFSLPGLARLDLAANNFSGGISPLVNNLTRLRSLFLQNNQLSGELPNINLPGLVEFNVSYNKLNGSIPPGLRSKPASSFLGMPLCGGPMPPCASETAPSASPSNPPAPSPPIVTPPSSGGDKKSSKLSGGAIAGIAVGSVAGILILVGLLIVCCRKSKDGGRTRSVEVAAAAAVRSKTPESVVPTAGAAGATGTSSRGNGEKRLVFFGGTTAEFDLEELLRASAEVLGKGAHGTTYKAVMEGGTTLVVKRLRDVNLEESEFGERIQAIGSVQHENVVGLRAYYYSKDEKLLVYDYLPGGSLSALLHGSRREPLDWIKRCRIALEAARGIQYIHSRGTNTSHGNIKSSNILLSRSNDVRVSDHGLPELSSSTSLNHVAGYRAPEVTNAQKVSQMADVYSFGVLLLELLTGKAPLQNKEGADLPRWVQSMAQEQWRVEVFDPELMKYPNVEEYMVRVVQLAMDCTALYPYQRPSMSDVVARLDQIIGSGSQQEAGGGIDDADDLSSRRTESTDDSRPPRS